MSYDISLRDPVTKEIVHFDSPHQMTGGAFIVGGTTAAWLNITYNYAKWYRIDGAFPDKGEDHNGIRSIYGLSGADSIPVLKRVIQTLENMDEDLIEEQKKEFEDRGVYGYWIPTRKNAIRPLYQLLAMATMRPDAVWDGD